MKNENRKGLEIRKAQKKGRQQAGQLPIRRAGHQWVGGDNCVPDFFIIAVIPQNL